MRKTNSRQVLKFLTYLRKLEAIEAIGIARLLKVDLSVRPEHMDANAMPGASIQENDFDTLLSEMLDAFIKLERGPRKRILEIMKIATTEIKE